MTGHAPDFAMLMVGGYMFYGEILIHFCIVCKTIEMRISLYIYLFRLVQMLESLV